MHDWHEVESQDAPGFPGVSLRWVISEREGAGRFAMRVFDVQPGAEIPLHDHWYEQEMFVLEGEGVAGTSDSETPMRPCAGASGRRPTSATVLRRGRRRPALHLLRPARRGRHERLTGGLTAA